MLCLPRGRLLGVQFGALFKDDLYGRIARHADAMAMRIRHIFEQEGYKAAIDSPTNQQFFVLPNEVMDRLLPNVSFELWGPRGEHETTVRFVTSWATSQADIDALGELLRGI